VPHWSTWPNVFRRPAAGIVMSGVRIAKSLVFVHECFLLGYTLLIAGTFARSIFTKVSYSPLTSLLRFA